jgi:hypothetical protein
MSIISVLRLFMFDEIHCKEFNSVADVIFGASNSTGIGGVMSRGIKKPR